MRPRPVRHPRKPLMSGGRGRVAVFYCGARGAAMPHGSAMRVRAPRACYTCGMCVYQVETRGLLEPYLSLEWLLTSGTGGFAMGTVVGCNTRRYHGLLCAAAMPPVGRIMALSRIAEVLYFDGAPRPYDLSVNCFRGAIHPRGYRHLRRFEVDRTARWHYELENAAVDKEVLLVRGTNMVGVRYIVHAAPGRNIELHLMPFVALRDYHALRRRAGDGPWVRLERTRLAVGEGPHALHMCIDAGHFARREDWWYGHVYPVEAERGLDDTEDLFVPAAAVVPMRGGGRVTLWASFNEPPRDTDWDARRAHTVAVPESLRRGSAGSDAVRRLVRASEDFIVQRRRRDGTPAVSILAGYPWFADWGRDTMISLPGLLLCTGRLEEARQVLELYGEHVSEGMIPNRFDDYTSEPSYNTVDASLWFINAVFAYLRRSGDDTPARERLMQACRAIVAGYRKGTRFGIGMDESDALIRAGDATTQLTWMDAKCDGVAFTPRHGKAVEINALWYNALMLLGEDDLAARVRESFVRTFWRNPFRGLYDVVDGDRWDGSIRPNQIFAASLPHSPLNIEQQRAVVEVVRRELLTPFGLRTLARDDPGYRGRFGGPPRERDAAYHNGTVWAWLIGPFLDAWLRVNDRSPQSVEQARQWLQPLINHLHDGCLGQISECFEGDEPHRPVGCPAQAWSVAEVLRLAMELGM